jgi:hypothetical protein|eukprot:COSAG01_NODE_8634_length_2713_cov_1.980107_2_plen_99_part_00
MLCVHAASDAVNNYPTCAWPWLLNDTARKSWGFDGCAQPLFSPRGSCFCNDLWSVRGWQILLVTAELHVMCAANARTASAPAVTTSITRRRRRWYAMF